MGICSSSDEKARPDVLVLSDASVSSNNSKNNNNKQITPKNNDTPKNNNSNPAPTVIDSTGAAGNTEPISDNAPTSPAPSVTTTVVATTATTTTKTPKENVEEIPDIEKAERIFKGVQAVSKAELYTWQAHEAISGNEETITNAAAKLAQAAEGWQKTKVGIFIGDLLAGAAKHTPAPFSAVVAAISTIVKIVVAISANKMMAKQLADRLVSLHPAMFTLVKCKYSDSENLAKRLLVCIGKCEEVLKSFADLGEGAGLIDKLKQKWGQFTTSPDDFNLLHSELDRVLQDVTFATVQQELVGPRKRPSSEELQQIFRKEASDIITQVTQHIDLKLDEKDQKDDDRAAGILFSISDLTNRVNILLEKAGEQDLDLLGNATAATTDAYGEIPSHVVSRVPNRPPLGSGLRATVYEGLLRGVIKIAMKCYHDSTSNTNNNNNNNPAQLARAEFEVLKKLQSVSGDVIRVYGIKKGTNELVMEKLDRSLEDFVSTNGKNNNNMQQLTLEQKLSITMCLIRALRALHGCSPHHIIHGDLKPGNVMLTESLFAIRLIDFGSASSRTTMTVSTSSPTTIMANSDANDGEVEMSLPYAAPELLEKGIVNEATDIFAFAVTCFELWTEGKAYHDKADIKNLILKQGARPEFPVNGTIIIPEVIRRMIEWCWAKEASVRPDAFSLNEIRKLWAGDLCRTSASSFVGLAQRTWPAWLQKEPPQNGISSTSTNSSNNNNFPSFMLDNLSENVTEAMKQILLQQQVTTLALFLSLTADELKEMFKIGDRKIIQNEIQRLEANSTSMASPLLPTAKIDFAPLVNALRASQESESISIFTSMFATFPFDHFIKQHDMFCVQNAGKSILHFAVSSNLPKFCNVFLTSGRDEASRSQLRSYIGGYEDTGYTPLMWAAMKGHVDCAEAMILNCNSKDQLELQSRETKQNAGFTALHHAAYSNQSKILRLLIQVGKASPEVRTNAGFTPLHTAVYAGHTECIQTLVEQLGANANAVTGRNSTPLFVAAERDNAGLIELFIGVYKVDVRYVTASTSGGFNLLHHAAYLGRANAVACLVAKFPALAKELLESKSAGGSTPLLLAVDQGHIAVVKVLVSFGANKKATNSRGKDALALAKNEEMKKALA